MPSRVDPSNDPLVYAVMGTYLALLLGIGWLFRRCNRDTDDYFRMGARGSWWFVGVSVFVSNMSAWTFTGGAGQAFDWGWSILFNYWPIAIGFVLCALVFAPWFRQLRATTPPEAIGLRFDELTRQIFSWKSLVGQPLISAVQLYGLAIFSSAALGFRLEVVIVTLGVVVTLYATLGGRFALTATDFLQAAIILPTAVLMAVLCLRQFGGIGGFFAVIESAGLSEQYRFVKTDTLPANGTYGTTWIAAAILFFMVLNNLNIATAARFFTVKDSREARRTAWLAAVLVFLGGFVWFIPAIASRLLYAEEVARLPLQNPAEGAYAVAVLHLLPTPLIGVMLVAIFAATMASMDGALNSNAAIAVRDVYPTLCRRFGWRIRSDAAQLRAARWLTLAFGLLVVFVALSYAQLKETTLFDLIMNVLVLTGVPFQVPLFWGLFVRRVPRSAALFAGLLTVVPAVIFFFDHAVLGFAVPWQTRVLVQFAVGTAAFFSTRLLWSRVSAVDRAHIDAFFRRMHTPVISPSGLDDRWDRQQLKLAGTFTLATAGGITALATTSSGDARRIVLLLATAYAALGATFLILARRRRHASPAAARPAAPPSAEPLVQT
jgi:SSS family transporter